MARYVVSLFHQSTRIMVDVFNYITLASCDGPSEYYASKGVKTWKHESSEPVVDGEGSKKTPSEPQSTYSPNNESKVFDRSREARQEGCCYISIVQEAEQSWVEVWVMALGKDNQCCKGKHCAPESTEGGSSTRSMIFMRAEPNGGRILIRLRV